MCIPFVHTFQMMKSIIIITNEYKNEKKKHMAHIRTFPTFSLLIFLRTSICELNTNVWVCFVLARQVYFLSIHEEYIVLRFNVARRKSNGNFIKVKIMQRQTNTHIDCCFIYNLLWRSFLCWFQNEKKRKWNALPYFSYFLMGFVNLTLR